MATSDVPLFSMLRTRMRWHQDRQKLLAENVANADTPGYRAREPRGSNFASMARGTASATEAASIGAGPMRTDARHIQPRARSRRASTCGGTPASWPRRMAIASTSRTRCELVAQNQLDYQASPASTSARSGSSGRQSARRLRRQLMSMDFLKSIRIAAGGMRAQAGRMRITAENIANASSDGPGRRAATPIAQDPDLPHLVRPRAAGDHRPARTGAPAAGRIPDALRSQPSGRRSPRVRQGPERQLARREPRHAGGPAQLRGEPQRRHLHPAHDPAHDRTAEV